MNRCIPDILFLGNMGWSARNTTDHHEKRAGLLVYYFAKELETGYVVIGDHPHLPEQMKDALRAELDKLLQKG